MIMHVTNKETNLKLIQTLYENRKHRLYYLAFHILQDEAAAEDSVLQCFAKLLETNIYSRLSCQQLELLADKIVIQIACNSLNHQK